MMKIFSATLQGVTPTPVEVEADLSNGLPFFEIVGLPDAFLRESKTRVKSAIGQAGFKFPNDSRLVLNLAPSRLRKEGSGFEIAIALKILQVTGQIKLPACKTIMGFAELGLDGSLRGDEKIEALSFASLDRSVDYVIVPRSLATRVKANQPDLKVVALDSLMDLREEGWWETHQIRDISEESARGRPDLLTDIRNISVTEVWARLIELTVVGGHNVLLCGPPGTGKTFFADLVYRFASCLRPPTSPSVEQRVLDCLFKRRPGQLPVASPHHSSSQAGLVGGSNPPQPGAITAAHGGILFLDELLEFGPKALDALREPLERGSITIQRSGSSVDFPSRFQLIAATNPCRCGYWRHPTRSCTCTQSQRALYFNRLSGPLMDRFAIRVFIDQDVNPQNTVTMDALAKRIQGHFEFLKSNEIELAGGSRILKSLSFRAQKTVTALAKTISVLEKTTQIGSRQLLNALDLQTLETLIHQPIWRRPTKPTTAINPEACLTPGPYPLGS